MIETEALSEEICHQLASAQVYQSYLVDEKRSEEYYHSQYYKQPELQLRAIIDCNICSVVFD